MPNHTLLLEPALPVHSQKEVTGTRQRRSGELSMDRQNGEARLRTLVTGRATFAGGGTPQVIRSSASAPSTRRRTGASRSG